MGRFWDVCSYPPGMPLIDPRLLTVDAVAMLALSRCPVCGNLGEEKPRHPFAPPIDCAWCAERQVVIERCLAWLKAKR